MIFNPSASHLGYDYYWIEAVVFFLFFYSYFSIGILEEAPEGILMLILNVTENFFKSPELLTSSPREIKASSGKRHDTTELEHSRYNNRSHLRCECAPSGVCRGLCIISLSYSSIYNPAYAESSVSRGPPWR